MQKSILMAIDGSSFSTNSLEYISKLFAADKQLMLHLFSVVSTGTAGKEWMLEVDPYRDQPAASDHHMSKARRHIRDAEERLLRNGFAKEQLTSEVRASSGICAAIRDKAEQGNYDSVVIGRRGLGAVGNMFLGSVSGDMVEQCHRTPLWIIDGNVDSSRFLLAVHSQPSSLLAADHLGFILKNHPKAEIFLYHSNSVFGKQKPSKTKDFHAIWGEEWCDKYLDIDNFLFYAHAQLLIEGGIPRSRIKQLPAQMHLDVGADLLRQAKQNQCGTIVIGRRSRISSRGQLKGVSDKTLKQADNIAVWLAG